MSATIISPAPFFTIRFRDNVEEIFNSDCYLKLLVQSIKLRCDCKENDHLALIDEEQHVTDLGGISTSLENGRCIFNSRGVYVLLLVHKTAEGVPQYKSLLNSQYMTSEVADKLDELNNIEPLPQLRKVRRINTIVPSKPPQPKRKQSVGTRKPLSPKARKINTRSLSPIRGD